MTTIVTVSALQLAVLSYQNRQITACQTKYNTQVATVLRARALITDDERKAQVRFLLSLRSAKSQAESNRKFQQYLAQVAGFEARRQNNPIPELSGGKCT